MTEPLKPQLTTTYWNERSKGRLPGMVGVELLEIAVGRVKGQVALRPELWAPNGFLHAATVIALADTLCGYGCVAALPEGASGFTTVETKTNHLGTATEGGHQLRGHDGPQRANHTGVGRHSHAQRDRQDACPIPLHADGALAEVATTRTSGMAQSAQKCLDSLGGCRGRCHDVEVPSAGL